LKQKVRETDYIGRIGGDEFALFLFDMTDKNEIERWVQDLLQKIQTIQYTKKFDRPITVSVGIALVKEESFYSELLERADKALYQVKKRGKNTYYMIDENVKN
jgi:diguanylate cyclase (GGDEF)-like protein